MKTPYSDLWYTPRDAILGMIPHLDKSLTYWEPCCGGKNISKVLKDHGYRVISTDITTGHDFLTYEPDFKYDAIITNPPFSIINKILDRVTELGKPWFLLMRLTELSTKKRMDIFRKSDISLYMFDHRIHYINPERGSINQHTTFQSVWVSGNLQKGGGINFL